MQRSRKNTSHSEEDDQPRQTDREAANIVEIANKDFKSYNCISVFQYSGWNGYTNIRGKNIMHSCKNKKIARNKKGHFKMIKVSIHQEAKTIDMPLTPKPENRGSTN